MNDIYIVTPVFNRKEFTRNYLLALEKQTNKNFKIIVIDDGSTDGTPQMIEKEFPDVILLKEKGDLWWAEATNIGVRFAKKNDASYIMTLNDDTLPEPDYIEKMFYWSKKYPDALLGALAIDQNTGKVIFGGENRDWKTGKSVYVLDRLSEDKRHGLHEVNMFPGRGLLIPMMVFDKIGLYDSKNFPQTIADHDFTHRAINNGFKIYCNFDAKIKIYPNESAGVQLKNKKSLRNYYNHLFGIRGGGNLKWFIICTWKNCPRKYIIPFMTKGILSRVAGYWKNNLDKEKEVNMKEKIIEAIKCMKFYPHLKAILYQTKENDYNSKLLTPNKTNTFISDLLTSEKPFILSRLGSSELDVIKAFQKNKTYSLKMKTIITRNAGFFPTDDKSLDKFCMLYETIIPAVDLIGISFIPFEDYMINHFAPNAKLTKIRNLEPYFYQDPWSKYLKGKKVLVIHPFASSIQSQFEKRDKLFKNTSVLPEFKLTTYKAAQTLGGGNGEFSSWFEALEKMQQDISTLDFDIAIIGAGVYGLPLAYYIKKMEKSAIHLGGATQMLFGVYGRRWEINPDFQDMINKHWIKPQADEKPKNASNVENACYW